MPLAFKPTTRTLHRKITKLFQALYLSVTAYLVYHTQSALSRTFFFFFRRPFGGSQLALNFSDRRPSRSSLFILPDSPRIVKNFFLPFSLFFFSRFAERVAPLLRPAVSLFWRRVSGAAPPALFVRYTSSFARRGVGFLLPFQYLCLRFSASHVIMTQIHL